MRTQLPLILATVVGPFAILTACVSDDAAAPDDVIAALEQENGGLDMDDEAPMFGDEALYAAAEIEADAPIADELETDPRIAAMGTGRAHDVMLLWGQLPADFSASPRDWSGSLRVSRGGLVLRRRIAFEGATDRVLPRTEPAVVEFDSITRPHVDGLVLTVLDPEPASAEPLTLTYTSRDGAVTHELVLADLADGPIAIEAGDGNRILAAGRARPPADTCEHGFLRGRWHALAPNHGVYVGVVANARGEVIGHVRGIYGQRRDGEPVMFGKMISRDGSFDGLLAGTYGRGHFGARWIHRDGDRGVAAGVYFEGPSLRGGGFLARWAERTCEAQ